MAEDSEQYVVEGVAANPNTPPEALAELAEDGSWIVRRSVARNPNAPVEVLAKLAEDDIADVRESVGNSRTGREESRSTKQPKNDWSVPLYELDSYDSIKSEIDDVVDKTMMMFENKYLNGANISYSIDDASYDQGNSLLIAVDSGDGHPETTEIDLQMFLSVITSKQNKKDCIKKGVEFLLHSMTNLAVL